MATDVANVGLASDQTVITCARRLLRLFEPLTLDELNGSELTDRIDTKYLLSPALLLRTLSGLSSFYRVLDIDGLRLQRYRTLYFDTPDFALYGMHHDGRANRYKVRSRTYLDSRRSFLEVKRRTSKERTVKKRIAIPGPAVVRAAAAHDFLLEQVPDAARMLESKLWNDFSRITLIGNRSRERLTLDLDLRFAASRSVALPGLAVAEVKQEGLQPSAFTEVMKALHARPTTFSKYCVGTALLYPALKWNNFKPQLLAVKRLAREWHAA
jgi:hypothetical protein